MEYLSWFGRKARTSRTVLLSVMVLAAVALSGASVPASAQAAPAHVASGGMALHLVVLRHSTLSSAETLDNVECVPPAGTICVGTGYDTSNDRCTGQWADIVNSANHSVWETFAAQHIASPSCFDARNSGSAMWVEDGSEDAGCVPQHQSRVVIPGLPSATMFFIRYNSACGSEPGGEPS